MEDRSRLQAQKHHPNISKQQQTQHSAWRQQPPPPPPPPPPHYRTSTNKSSSQSLESSANLDSPTKFHSPARSDPGEPTESPPYSSPAGSPENHNAIVSVANKSTQCFSPSRPPLFRDNHNFPRMGATMPAQPKRAAPSAVGEEEGGKSPAATTTTRRSKGRTTMRKTNLWLRVLEVLLCTSSFSVMAADRTQGWSGDSYDRYLEYRFCLYANIIAFAYSSFQAYNSAYHLITGKHVIRHHLRCHFDFFMDQVLSYLILAAASAAATRVTDWVTNWGKDEFTEMASASIALSFLGFIIFSFSSLISAHNLWNKAFT